MTEICRKCAECCKNHPIVDLSSDEIVLLEKTTGLPLESFTNRKGKEDGGYFLQFRTNGHCLFLDEDAGGFSCSVYEARPAICRHYPAKPIQKNLCDANAAKFLIA